METFKGVNAVYPKTRAQWRSWLKKHHARTKAVWLITYIKKSGKPAITYEESVEEALCYGWIDSVKYKRDVDSTYQYFGPRKPKSVWSKLNRNRVAKLIKEGKMTPAGQKMIDLAKKNGQWNALKHVEKMTVPPDLKLALEKNKKAKTHFEKFPPSAKQVVLFWIAQAKRPETRKARIKKTVQQVAKNLRMFTPQPKRK